MAVEVGQLYQTLELRDKKFNKSMNNAEKKTGKFSKMLGGLGKVAAAGAATAGAALAGIGAKGIQSFQKYEKQMNEVFTLMPNASEEAQQKMSADLQKFSEEMGVMTDKAAPALYQAISAGVPKDNVFTFMEQAQKAAVGGATELQTTVDGLSSVVNTYGKEQVNAAEASDLMFTAVKQGKTTFEELSANMSDVAPIASSMGIEFSNVTAALSTMTSQGVPTAKATTQLKQAMSELSKEGSKAGKNFQEVAGQSFQSFIKEGGNMQEAMSLMQQAAKENNTTVSNMFGSIEAGQAALALTGKNAQTFRENLKGMESSAGATEEAYNQMDQSLSRSFDKIKASSNTMMIAVGKELRPVVADFANMIAENMPQIKSTITTVFSAVVDAIYTGIDAYKTIRNFINSFVSNNEQKLNQVKSKYSEIFGLIQEIITQFTNIVTSLWDTFGADITEKAKVALDLVKDVFDNKLAIVKNALEAVLALMKGDWDEFGKNIGEIISLAYETIANIISTSWSKLIKPALTALIGKIKDEWSGLPAKMKDIGGEIINGVVSGMSDKAKNAVKKVGEVGQKIKDGFKNFFGISSPSKVFAEYGRNLMEGVVQGVNAKAGDVNDTIIEAFKMDMKWGEKLKQQRIEMNMTELERLKMQKEEAIANAEAKGASTYALEKFYNNKINQVREENAKKEEKRQQNLKATRQRIMNKWTDKVIELSTNRMQQINKEEREAIRQVKERAEETEMTEAQLERTINNIKKVYSQKRKEIRKQEEEQKKAEKQRELARKKAFEKKWNNKLKQNSLSRIERLKLEREKAIAEAEKLNASKKEIRKFYEQEITRIQKEEQQKRENKLRKSLGFLKSGFKTMFSDILSGTKSVTEAFKGLWDSVIQSVINKLAEMAASKAFEMVINMATGGTGGTILSGLGSLFGGIFHNGGTVPGPIGQERLIMAQAGETVTPIGSSPGGQSSGMETANITVELDGRTIAKAVEQPLADRIRIKGGVKM